MAVPILPEGATLSAALSTKRVLYEVTNLANGKRYVGVTKNLERRMYRHVMGFGSLLLRNAVRKHGPAAFRYQTLAVGDASYIYSLEPQVIALYKTLTPNGYNMAPGGERGPDITGRKLGPLSSETRRAMSLVRRGRKKGPHSAEAKKNMSLASKGRPKSPEHRAAISLAQKGKRKGPLSMEHRRAVSLAKTGKSNGHEGKTHSDAHNKAISAGLLGHVGATKGMRWRLDESGKRIFWKAIDDQKTTA